MLEPSTPVMLLKLPCFNDFVLLHVSSCSGMLANSVVLMLLDRSISIGLDGLYPFPSLTAYENSTSPFQSFVGVKVQLPSVLALSVPSPLLSFRSVMESASPSTSELFFSSCSLVIRMLPSSSMAPRSTGPETMGASLTASSSKLLLALISPPRPSLTV